MNSTKKKIIIFGSVGSFVIAFALIFNVYYIKKNDLVEVAEMALNRDSRFLGEFSEIEKSELAMGSMSVGFGGGRKRAAFNIQAWGESGKRRVHVTLVSQNGANWELLAWE